MDLAAWSIATTTLLAVVVYCALKNHPVRCQPQPSTVGRRDPAVPEAIQSTKPELEDGESLPSAHTESTSPDQTRLAAAEHDGAHVSNKDGSHQTGSNPTRTTVFRARGIPAFPDDRQRTAVEVERLMRTAFPVDPEIKIMVESLANSPTTPHEMVATVSFSDTPACLARNPKGDGEFHAAPFEYGVSKHGRPRKVYLTLDTHFHGITPLHTPEGSEWLVDVIAISGLNGHAFGSFKAKGNSFMWLRDDLPYSFPGARVWTYGYDSKLLESISFQGLLDFGMRFSNALRSVRSGTGVGKALRPLILIGHSLGGLIVKEALCQILETRMESDEFLLRSVYGILFFGVPNHGMAIQSLLPMVQDQPNETFVRSLAEDESILRLQAQRFSELLNGFPDINVTSFFETMESPTARLLNGKWSMSGPPARLVGISSATHGRPWVTDKQNVYPINKNHSELVKFSGPHDTDYKEAVLPRLLEIKTHVRKSWPLSQEQKDCLQSLSFPDQNFRPDQIASAEHNTCTWILRHPAYVKWLNGHDGLLWIEGSPGVGKSTIMKFAVQAIEKAESKRQSDALILSFFFHGRGSELQRTPTGLLRSLLNQLLRYVPDSLSELTSVFQERSTRMGLCDKAWSWGHGELQGYLRQYLREAATARPILIFVDALDECGSESARNLKMMFNSILSEGAKTKRGLKICFSCRYYPNLRPATLKDEHTIAVEQRNSADIATVVRARLLDMDPEKRGAIEGDIISRARGVFQWVILVCVKILELDDEGASIRRLQNQIQQVPQDLNELYSSLLQERCGQELSQTIKLFQWVCFAKRPLRIPEIRHVLVIGPESREPSFEACKHSEDFRDEKKDVIKAIKTLSKGLAEVKSYDGVVQLIHQSVLDYLLNYWFKTLLPERFLTPAGHGHFVLSRSCIYYLSLEEVRKLAKEPHQRKIELSLVTYALDNLEYHLECVETEGVDQSDLLALFSWPLDAATMDHYITLRTWSREYGHTWSQPFTPTRFVHFLASLGINSALNVLIRDGKAAAGAQIDGACVVRPEGGISEDRNAYQDFDDAGNLNLDLRDSHNRLPIHYAAMRGHLASVKSLLKPSGTKPDVQDHFGNTPLNYAIRNDDLGVISELLASDLFDANAQDQAKLTLLHHALQDGKIETAKVLLRHSKVLPNVKDEQGRTPLHFAVREGLEDMVDLLLKKEEVDVNARDNNGETPLHVAAFCQRESLISKLLEAKAIIPDMENEEGDTPFTLSIRHTKVQSAKAMVSSPRVDMNTQPPPLIMTFRIAVKELCSPWIHVVDKYPLKQSKGYNDGFSNESYSEMFQVLLNSDRIDPNRSDGIGGSHLMTLAYQAYMQDTKAKRYLRKVLLMLLSHPRVNWPDHIDFESFELDADEDTGIWSFY